MEIQICVDSEKRVARVYGVMMQGKKGREGMREDYNMIVIVILSTFPN